MSSEYDSIKQIHPFISIDNAFVQILNKITYLERTTKTVSPVSPINLDDPDIDIDQVYQAIQKKLNNLIHRLPPPAKSPPFSQRVQQKIKEKFNFDILNNSKSAITSFLELPNKNLVIGRKDGNIQIILVNYESKTVTTFFTRKIHKDEIISLCYLKSKILITCSWDYSIIIFQIQNKFLVKLNMLKIKEGYPRKVIPLSNYRFAYCADNSPIQIMEISDVTNVGCTIKCIASLREREGATNAILLQSKTILAACYYKMYSIQFWDLQHYNKINTVKNAYTFSPNGMIELSNSFIAVSQYNSPFHITIIDPFKFEIVKQITNKYISGCSPLCLVNNDTFVYVYHKRIVLISCDNFEVVGITSANVQGKGGIILVNNNKYLAIHNNVSGIGLFEILYNN